MTIVITMAGLGSRFRKAGYTVPKYQIEVNGHTLFYWSMLSLTGFATKKYVFIVRKEDNASAFITEACREFGVYDPTILEIDHLTSGQAETATLAAPWWDENEPLLIYNIDTYVEAGQMRDAQLKGDGFIPCFAGEGDHWSFVRLERQGGGDTGEDSHLRQLYGRGLLLPVREALYGAVHGVLSERRPASRGGRTVYRAAL